VNESNVETWSARIRFEERVLETKEEMEKKRKKNISFRISKSSAASFHKTMVTNGHLIQLKLRASEVAAFLWPLLPPEASDLIGRELMEALRADEVRLSIFFERASENEQERVNGKNSHSFFPPPPTNPFKLIRRGAERRGPAPARARKRSGRRDST